MSGQSEDRHPASSESQQGLEACKAPATMSSQHARPKGLADLREPSEHSSDGTGGNDRSPGEGFLGVHLSSTILADKHLGDL